MDDVDKVAVKMLQPGVLKQSVLDAFCNEISILHGLRHPNVVMMIGAYLTEVGPPEVQPSTLAAPPSLAAR